MTSNARIGSIESGSSVFPVEPSQLILTFQSCSMFELNTLRDSAKCN